MADVKRTSMNLDPSVVADAKIALVEAERLGIESPRNLSALVNAALAQATRELSQKIEHVRHGRGERSKAGASRRA
jgi:hypothetical protein